MSSPQTTAPLAKSPNKKTPTPTAWFSVLTFRDFRLLWAGQFISTIGTQMQLVAVNWHVYLLTKSALALGIVGLVRVIPIILCSLMGGLIADAVDRRRMMLITQSVMLASAAALGLFTAAGMRTVLPIYILTALSSAAVAFDNPARQAMMPTLVPARNLPNAISLGMVSFQVATIVGPVLAGLVLASATNGYYLRSSQSVLYGPAIVYMIDAASFIAVIVALLMMKAGKRSYRVNKELIENIEAQMDNEILTSEEERRGIRGAFSFASLREGVEFVWRTPIIVQTMALDFTATFFASATALLPIFAAEVLHVGASGLGWLAAAPAIGASAAGIFMARRGDLSKPGAAIIGSISVYGAATIVFGASRIFWLSLLMLAVTGAADTVSTVLRQTIRQLATPDRLRGRMTSINMIFFMGGPQLGELEAGVVAQFAGASFSVVIGGIGCMMAVLVAAMKARSLLSYRFQTDKT